MIPKNKDPFIDSPFIDEKKLDKWRKAIDENKEQRHKDFCKAYADMEKANAKLKEALKSNVKLKR